MKLQISDDLKAKLPGFNIVAYTFSLLEINDSNHLSEAITTTLDDLSSTLKSKYSLDDVVNIKRIKEARDAYKRLGKDPSHTRVACEALLRRIIKYGNIYRLGNVIDIGNLLSLTFLKSVCVADLDEIKGDIFIRIGTDEDEYYGINRGKINVQNLPLYTDDISPFGSPTSDTTRTAITSKTKNVLVMLINFSFDDLEKDEKQMVELLKKLLKIKDLRKINVQGRSII